MSKYIITILFVLVLFAGVKAEALSIVYPPYNPSYCTTEYNPVCGQKMACPTCGNYGSIPCVGCYLQNRTYSNVCLLNQDGARLIHYGECGSGGSANRPPTISSFSGPTTLNVNEQGTWRISANDPENGQLTYDIDWGDHLYYVNDTVSNQRSSFTQSTTFQHSYARAGTYTVSIIVKDSAGKTVKSTTTVRVNEVYYPQPVPQPWPYYYDYSNYYDNYYDNYYYDWSWQNQNPYGWGAWNTWDWNNNQNNYWSWQY